MPYRETAKIRDHKAAQHQKILRCAESVVRKHGFGGLTIQAVADRAQVGVGTVYRYFPAKDALATDVFCRATQRETDALRNVLQQEGQVIERLCQGIALFAQRALLAPRLAWSLIAEPADASVDAARNQYRRNYTLLFARLLDEGVESGQLPAQDTDLAAASLVGGLAESLLGPLRDHRDAQNTVSELQTFWLRAVGADETGAARPDDGANA